MWRGVVEGIALARVVGGTILPLSLEKWLGVVENENTAFCVTITTGSRMWAEEEDVARGSRPRVYLAGPITGLSYGGATDWRESVSKELWPEVVGVSPMRGKDYLKMIPTIGGTSSEAYTRMSVISHPKGVITRDRWDVATCDAVLMNLLGAERVSIGTMIEAGWADAHRKPVIVVREEKNIHSHMMLDEIAGYTVDNLEEAVHIVKLLFFKGAYVAEAEGAVL